MAHQTKQIICLCTSWVDGPSPSLSMLSLLSIRTDHLLASQALVRHRTAPPPTPNIAWCDEMDRRRIFSVSPTTLLRLCGLDIFFAPCGRQEDWMGSELLASHPVFCHWIARAALSRFEVISRPSCHNIHSSSQVPLQRILSIHRFITGLFITLGRDNLK